MTGALVGLLAATVVGVVGLTLDGRVLPVRGRARTPRALGKLGPAAEAPAGPGLRMATARRPRRWARSPAAPSDADLATWCERLARRVRTGDTLSGAIRTVDPPPSLRPAIAPVVLALDRGADVTNAALAGRHRSAGLDAVLTVVGACGRLGGPAAEPLDRTASALRRRVADAADRRTQSAQARASALTLTLLPAVFLLLMTTTSASVRAGVSSTPGVVAVVAGLSLNLVGWCWMRRIIRGAS